MSDIKNLFKRDGFYWGIMMAIIALVVIYMLSNVSGAYPHTFFHLEDYAEREQWLRIFYDHNPELLRDLWDKNPQLRDLGSVCYDEISNEFLKHMTLVTVIVVLIAQAVKLLTQETKNRTEVLRTFPIKSRNLLFYHYLSGLLTIGILLLIQIALIRLDILYVEKNTDFIFTDKEKLWNYVGSTIFIFIAHYSLLLVCKKVTNNVTGTIFTFVLAELAGWYCFIKLFWIPTVLIASIPVVLILLSFIAEQKKDYARNGFYAFPIAHWVMMAIVFGEIYLLFHGVCLLPVSIAGSALITAGVHFVAKPKKI